MVLFMLFHVGFTSVMLGALQFIVWKAGEHKFCCILTEQNTLFHVRSGFHVWFARVPKCKP